jgi:hypothetical protein
LLRDVPAELVEWAGPIWRADESVPGYVPELAEHELATFWLASSDPAPAPSFEVGTAIDRPLVFATPLRFAHYRWAVQELIAPSELTRAKPPTRREVHLLGYRDPSHAPRWLELSPLAAAIVERLLRGEPLGAAVTVACTDRGASIDTVELARMLSDFASRGILLGVGTRS